MGAQTEHAKFSRKPNFDPIIEINLSRISIGRINFSQLLGLDETIYLTFYPLRRGAGKGILQLSADKGLRSKIPNKYTHFIRFLGKG
jgi:hypothetical protein